VTLPPVKAANAKAEESTKKRRRPRI
jgi:hypothetical protein